MSYQLKVDEILEALLVSNHPAAPSFQAALEGLANAMATALAQSQGVLAGVGDFQGVAFAGLCVPFRPAFEGQRIPDCMAEYDSAEEWEFDPDDADSELAAPSLASSAPGLLAELRALVHGNYGQPWGVHVPALDSARAIIARLDGQPEGGAA